MGIERLMVERGPRAAALGGVLALLVACAGPQPASVDAGAPSTAPPRPASPAVSGASGEPAASSPAPPSEEVVVATASGPDVISEIESPFGHYLAGRHARTTRDITSAADFYSQVLDEDPENAQILRRTFFLLVADGRVAEAVPLAERIAEKPTRNGVSILVLALRDFRRGAYEEVLVRLGTAPRTGFNTLLLPLAAAWAQAAQDRSEAAIEALDPLAATESFAPFQAYHTALIQDFLKRPEAADAAFREAVAATSGGTLRLIEAYGAFLERQGRVEAAIELYQGYARDRPGNSIIAAALERVGRGEAPPVVIPDPPSGLAEALFDAASTLVRDNARDAAQIFARLALYLKPDFDLAHTLLGELFEAERRWQRALDAYAQVDQSSPYFWNARLRVAASLDRLERTAEAADMLRRMMAEYPERTDAVISLADILRARERYDEAVAAYDRAFERIDELEGRHWSLLYARGIALERSRQWPRAEADFLRALELEPDQPLVLNYLGYSWIEQGTGLEEALEMIERAVELRPEDGYIIDSLGWAHFRLANFEEAVIHLERAVERRPEDPTINDHLGDAYWRVGRYNEARFQWRRALSLDPDKELIPVIQAKLEAGLAPTAANRGS